MNPFAYERATDPADAVARHGGDPDVAYVDGGSNLLDHLKLGIRTPSRLVDVGHLGLDEITPTQDGGLRIGTNVRNSDLAAHPAIRRDHPLVARALLAGASGQLRHQASTGGNLLQRTRCVYFQDLTTPCNKREPGAGCSADHDEARTRENAVLGTSEHCVAVHPGDLAVALRALDAVVVVRGTGGERRVAMGELHRLPGDRPDLDTTLEHGDLITAVELAPPTPGAVATYVKVRDRASYAFALVSVAAELVTDGETISHLRLAWGGVAHAPWRPTGVETALVGGPVDSDAVLAACEEELSQARTWPGNAFKVPLLARTTAHAIEQLATRPAGAAA